MEESYPDRRVQRSATNSSIFTGIGQRLTNSLQRRPTIIDSADDLRGPLGLRALNDPKDAFVEFVFVHGLRGGSRSTWTLNDDAATFWPLWLEDSPQFTHVRIHTFGYNADFQGRFSVTNVNDFGITLLESLVNSAQFRRDASNPVVLIAHSLGGLVVKTAFNIAKQNPKYHQLSRRFHTLFFLATPHRGADSATMLNNILRASGTSAPRGYISDLEPNSSAVEHINENFRHNYHGIRLWSFYETLPTFANTTDLVVDKRSSILGFSEERQIPLNTDHPGACRFATFSDPAFLLIRDALAGTVEEILDELLDPDKVRDQMRLLADYLGVSDAEEEELSTLENIKVDGSCKWLLQKQSFIDWRDTQSFDNLGDTDVTSRMRLLTTTRRLRHSHRTPPRFFWLIGAPGSGKSVLAGHVIRHLQDQDRECHFYFLKHSDKSKQNLSGLLKSLAYQMARHDVALRQSLLAMRQEDELTAEINDVRAIWKQLFVQRILRTNFQQRQYWVIDALDEAHGGHDLVPLLAKIPEHLPISIFFTSRRDLSLEKRLSKLPVVTEHIEISDSLGDIRLYLEDNVEDLPVSDPAAVHDLIDKLVQKSQGSFLWTHLILQKLENSWSDAAIGEVLDSIPTGLQEMYSRILEDMAEAEPSNQELAKSILRWVVCGGRPLTTSELQEAIRLDTGQTVYKLERMIESVCGQLVTVDKYGRVQLVHDTARDFILDHNLQSEFAIHKAETHGHLADICLRYLTEDARTPAPRRPIQASGEPSTQIFREYANLYFSEHIVKSPPAASQNPMTRLEYFLETSVLSWIEYIAGEKRDLSYLTQTAKNLKDYVKRRVDFQSPLSQEMKTVEDWAVDLIRLVTVFGRHLLSDPSAIHRIIPPLCPSTSILHRKFGNPTLGIEVVGLSTRGWADRIHSTSFAPDEATALTCCEKRYAVGLRNGTVILYYASTCQEACRLDHGEQVRHLEFAHGNMWLIVCGKRMMGMWNYETAQKIWSTNMRTEPMALTLTENDMTIIAATKNNQLVSFDTVDGLELERIFWHGEERDPQRMYISSDLSLLALVYRNKPIVLFELGDPERGALERPRYVAVQASVSALAFNPALTMLAVAFFDGELCTIGLWNLQEINRTQVDASHMAVSTDGKTLIVGTNLGSIQVRDFDTLNLIYTINFGDEGDEIVSMTFTGNGLRFLDIRRQEFNVWEPSALFRRKDNDDSTSEGQTSYSTAPSQLVQAYILGDENPITAIVSHETGDFVFCGREDGAVTVYETRRGKPLKELFRHVKTSVRFLDWNSEKQILVSSDSSSRILVHRLKKVQTRSSTGTRHTWQSQMILERRLDQAIRQILISNDGEYLLVSTPTADHLWTLHGESVLSQVRGPPGHTRGPSQKWMTHPRHKRQIFEVDKDVVRVIRWDRNSNTKPAIVSMPVGPRERIDHESRDIGIHFVKFGDDIWTAYDNDAATRPVIWNGPLSSTNSSAPAAAAALAYFRTAAPKMKGIIGMFRSQLVFLNLEGWICSMRLDEAGQEKRLSRHFPIPHCWQHTSRRLVASVTVQGDLIITKGDELAIVKRGLTV